MQKKIKKSFIDQQKKVILKEQTTIVAQINHLKEEDPFTDPDHVTDNAAIDTDVREQVGHETVEAEIKDLQKRFDDLKLALKRIEKNKYGYCDKCSSQIPLTRLKIVPEAQYCIDCEQKLRK